MKLTIQHFTPRDPEWHNKCQQAFDMLRESRRYSSSTLMGVLALQQIPAEEDSEDSYDHYDQLQLEYIAFIGTRPSYDPLTEAKKGGIAGVAVRMPGDQSPRLLLTVAKGHRRRKVGTELLAWVTARELHINSNMGGEPATVWISKSNAPAAALLGKAGYLPSSFTARTTGWVHHVYIEDNDDATYYDPVGERFNPAESGVEVRYGILDVLDEGESLPSGGVFALIEEAESSG